MKNQHVVVKGWCNQCVAITGLKCTEHFTRGLPKRLKSFAHKRQVEDTSIVMELSIPFHTLVKLGDAEDFRNKKSNTPDLPEEINNVTSKKESQKSSAEIYDPNPEIVFTPTINPNNTGKHQFRKNR